MDKRELTVGEAKKELAAIGYKLTTRKNSQWVSGKVISNSTGRKVSGCNCMSQGFYDEHIKYFLWKMSVEIFDNPLSQDRFMVIL